MGIYRFGQFELNEESRGLHLAGRELAVQPLVFDFLALLLRHRDKALSKAELLDALWPGVTVTEASLQRVASLARAILREGNMDSALRNLPRFGYRLLPDTPVGQGHVYAADAPPSIAAASTPVPIAAPTAHLAAARAAIAARKWKDAADAFAAADAESALLPADLEDWSLAIECNGQPSDTVPHLTRAVAGYSMSGQRLRAANAAISLSRIHLERGELAVSSGWHKRAASLIGNSHDSREHGLWCYMGSRIAGAEGDSERALACAEQARALGSMLDDPVVESLGLVYRGFFKMCLGETRAGLEDQDFAAALGLSSDIDPIAGGVLYCNILWACRMSGDWARADQWSANYTRWYRECGIEDLTGSCNLHRAEVLSVQGTLKEAEAIVRTALHRLEHDAPWAKGDALRVLGDIHLAAGDLAQAEADYRAAYEAGWDPQPGHALLLLEQGNAEAAFRSLERSLLSRAWPTQQRRGILLATLAKAAVRTERTEHAAAIVAELEADPRRWPHASIRALIAEAKAEIMLSEARPDEAVRELQNACSFWTEIGSAFNAAEARLSLAALLLRLDDWAGSEFELGTARSIARKVDSPRLSRRYEALEASLAGRKAKTAG
jgi:DNA-binding winged helix-turn-helix (wHTH) protein